MPWWPAGYARQRAERVFEIAVGAVLTQNTNWKNVERALANLDGADALGPAAVDALADEALAELIRPSGFYRVKTRRLRAFTEAWLTAGGYECLERMETPALRGWLLGIHGIGRETADDILLYGFQRPVWVIDSYTRRLFARLGFPALAESPYDELAADLLEATPAPDAERLAQWHGLVVEHAKAHCRVRPACGDCPLRERCAFALG
ncbi:endonuclease III domain-containing protein [Guyparkeria hydrothermalis]|uniref:endonuclease III domain-containing protein n=1 Tax=Guyparkeria hydrothermalis TaxID=923 RepID=UPI003D9C6EA9